MVDPLVHFSEMQRAGYGLNSRTIKTLCDRYDVPVIALNKRQYALRQRDYDLLLARASGVALPDAPAGDNLRNLDNGDI